MPFSNSEVPRLFLDHVQVMSIRLEVSDLVNGKDELQFFNISALNEENQTCPIAMERFQIKPNSKCIQYTKLQL